jgi:hypothetical protein
MAAVEVGGTPPPHDSFVPLLDHETGTVYFLDNLTGELVDGASLHSYSSKKSGTEAPKDFDPVRAWHFETGCTLPLPMSPPALKSLSSSQESPLLAAPLQDRAQKSPTSVALFGDFEPFEAIPFEAIPLSGLSNFVQSDTSTTFSAYGTSTTSLFSARTTLYSTHKIPTTTCGVSSAYEMESDSLCIPYVQDFPSSSIPIAINGPDPPNFLIAPSFFSYWFDGFMPSQFLCALIILTILPDVPFDDVILKVRLSNVPKARLSNYFKETIYCLDLACTKAGLRAAKSIASVPATIAAPSSELLQSVDLRSFSGFKFSDRLCPAKISPLGTAADLWATSSLNSA